MASTSRPWVSYLLGTLAWLGLLVGAASCSDDEVCSVEDNAGCPAGQACQVGKNGEVGCFCTPGVSGCEAGFACELDVATGDPACFCSPRAQSACGEGLVCETVVGANPGCFPPVLVRGQVFDLATGEPIEGALVAARDANNAAVSDVAPTDANGGYELAVLTPRNPDGSLVDNEVSLRADAAGYLTFPKPPRTALPFDTSKATGDPLVVDSPATDIGLIALESTSGLGTITGTVLTDFAQGTLVVAGGEAGGAGGGVTGIAGFDGTYTIFNVPAGSVNVRGYATGLQLAPATAEVSAGAVTSGVDLGFLGAATATVSGKIEIVNPGMGKETSVILVVNETFIENAASGETPPGLRIAPVSGAFSIANVPNGNYVVLAAFENDFLVRDPDQSIGGTAIVRLTVNGASTQLPESFKVTGALDVVSPDAEEVVGADPTFVWVDDSGEDHYEVQVYDVFGTLVWEDLAVPGVSGSATVEVPYAGPALESGMLYQFRATSIKNNGSPIARTEDLRGVFLVQ